MICWTRLLASTKEAWSCVGPMGFGAEDINIANRDYHLVGLHGNVASPRFSLLVVGKRQCAPNYPAVVTCYVNQQAFIIVTLEILNFKCRQPPHWRGLLTNLLFFRIFMALLSSCPWFSIPMDPGIPLK
jgi:hypothetical protein